MLSFVLPSRLRIGAVDSKAGSWQHAGCMLQPAWLFRRKANPPPPTKRQSIERCSVFVCAQDKKARVRESLKSHVSWYQPSLSLRDISPRGRDKSDNRTKKGQPLRTALSPEYVYITWRRHDLCRMPSQTVLFAPVCADCSWSAA